MSSPDLMSAFDLEAGDEALDSLARLAGRLIGSPVALVTLVGEERQDFLGRAGLDGERHTPIEVSICRYAVADDAPVIIEDTRSDDRVPAEAVDGLGVKAYAGVPVHAGGVPIGALCAIDHVPRRWSSYDITLLQDLAATANAVIDARLTERKLADQGRRDAELSALLQRSLLPVALPRIDGVRLAAAFQPADEIVGGDFYDAFRLAPTCLAFALGDVVGHGVEAAAAASQMRNTLRTHALEDADPAFVGTGLNDLAGTSLQVAYSSMVYGLLDTERLTLKWVNFGHPPALIRKASGAVSELSADHPVLGVHPVGTPLEGRVLQLERGDVLLAYTDGLVERRGADRTARVRELLAGEPDPDALVRAILAELVGSVMRDDVAVFCLQLV
jgi:sigma-B regulation protein RsbU (phosphoserine phosphatase)